jgi:hypothetical protein
MFIRSNLGKLHLPPPHFRGPNRLRYSIPGWSRCLNKRAP